MKVLMRLAVAVFCILAVAGCSLSSWQKSQMDKTLEDFHVTRFEFGTIGSVDVAAAKGLVMDGRSWNYSELLASVFQDALKERGFPVGKLLPTKGGAYALDELRPAGRTLLLSPAWYASGNIRTTVYIPFKSGRLHVLPMQRFSDVQTHYASEEALYDGLRAELRPLVEMIIDAMIKQLREYGMSDL